MSLIELSGEIKAVYIECPHKLLKKTLRALVRQRTIPTERPPLLGEVSANFSG
jgi:hypothetical protein